MDIAEHFCSEETVEKPRKLEPLTRSLATQLHTRIMADAYKYKLMSPEDEDEGYEPRAKKSHCLMKSCLVIFIVIAIVQAILLILMWNKSEHKEECLTEDCVEVSAYILKKMNTSFDPCVDFYSYSCGGWETSTLIPRERAKYDTFAEINVRNQAIIRMLLEDNSTLYKGHNSSAVAKLKTYYRSCMNVEKVEAEGTKVIQKYIKALGSWSISPDNSMVDSKSWDLVSSLAEFHRLGWASLFSFSLNVDSKNSSRYLLTFSQAGLTLDSEEEYLEDTGKFKKAFLDFAVQTGKLLGGDNSTYQKMEAIYNLEKSMAQIYMKKEDRGDPLKNYNLLSVEEFQKIIGDQINVKLLMSKILDKNITDSQVVRVYTVDYFRKLGPILANTSSQVLQDYLMWHMIETLPGYLPQTFVNAAIVLNEVEQGTSSVAPRWQRCIAKAEDAFGFVSSALYVDKTFPPENKEKALKILTEVQTAFIENLDKLPWMDKKTRDKARTKASMMRKAVGCPDWILDPVKLDEFYEMAEVKEGELLNNFFAISKYEVHRLWASQGEVPDKDVWSSKPDEPNAYFSSTFNQIIIQAGLLQPPYFDPHYPMSFAYGAMAMISGHELTHGFDNEGRKYDENGNLKDWWSAKSAQEFQTLTQCVVDQYSAFTYDGTHLNGIYTLGENIADNGGLKLGYAAYLSAKARGEWEEPHLPGISLTPQQLFFVGFAQIWCGHYTPEYAQHSILVDVHSINKFRVQGPVSNMPQFAQAFHCPAGAPLNPAHKCRVW